MRSDKHQKKEKPIKAETAVKQTAVKKKAVKQKAVKKKGLYTVLILLCIVVFLFALYKVVDILIDYKQMDDFYDDANGSFVVMGSDGIIDYVDLAKIIALNEDVKGWIYIEDTEISYPVLQGKDNDYYLFRTYKKEYLGAGSIFLEAANSSDFTDSHTIIYGHNMHNGSMFGSLDKFMKEEYRDDHANVYILRPDGKWYKYEIFSSYIADIDDGTFEIFKENQAAYDKYMSLMRSKNIYRNTAVPTSGENILTLSTCTEDSDDYKRYVLQAVLIGQVENIHDDLTKDDED